MIAYARHRARLRAKAQDGATREAHLQAAAARGHAAAIMALEGPAFPEALRGLWTIFERLDTMRGVGMHGMDRLSPTLIGDASRLLGWALAPHEVEALFLLDAVTLYPGDEE